MVSRCGDFVRYLLPLKGTTLLLWFGPGVLFVLVPLPAAAGDALAVHARLPPQRIAEIVAGLVETARKNAENSQGWIMLARSYFLPRR